MMMRRPAAEDGGEPKRLGPGTTDRVGLARQMYNDEMRRREMGAPFALPVVHHVNKYLENQWICTTVAVWVEIERKRAEGTLKERGYIARLSRATEIPESTLREWRDHALAEDGWSPWDKDYGNRAVFSAEEQAAICCMIKDNFITPGFVFTDEDFLTVAMDAYREKLDALDRRADGSFDEFVRLHPFQCSKGFMWYFKLKHRFSSRAVHHKRRSTVSPEGAERWQNEIRQLLDTVDHGHIFNCDETSWKVYPNGVLTWAEKGAETVSVNVQGNEKDCLTVLATIAADKTKVPLVFYAQGKTDVVENTQLGDVGYHWKTHSESGWQTEETFRQYLYHLRGHVGAGFGPIWLLLDLHASHRTERIQNLAADLGINLKYVPAGLTDRFQPLDVRVFGVLKAKAKAAYRLRTTPDHHIELNRTKQNAVEDMIWAWETMDPSVIESAWEQYQWTE
jgi:hypothetical protein